MKENDKFESIVQKFCQKAQRNKGDLCFLYGGQIINMNLTFKSLANSLDKQRKVISIIVTENDGKDDSILIKEIKDLKEKLLKANKTIEEQKTEIQDLKYKITMIKSEGMSKIKNLMETIENKIIKLKI